MHGFTGHPARTWTHKKSDAPNTSDNGDGNTAEPPSKIRRVYPFSTSRQGRGDSVAPVCWPRDLLPVTIPSGRVLTYGYDTNLRHVLGRPLSRATVYDIAWDFLAVLEAERRTEPARPILFIAHSLGGIVVKEMLRRASGCQPHQPHLCSVFDSTVGIVFFGTPHGGADPRGFLQHVAEILVKAAGMRVNDQIVNTLLPSSERLRELRDEFGPIAYSQDWMLHSFQEGLGIKYLDGRKVVIYKTTNTFFSIVFTLFRLSRIRHPVSTFRYWRRPSTSKETTWTCVDSRDLAIPNTKRSSPYLTE